MAYMDEVPVIERSQEGQASGCGPYSILVPPTTGYDLQ